MREPEIIHDHPECDGENAEIMEEGYCRSCFDKWWDEIEDQAVSRS